MSILTEAQVRMMRHALGLDETSLPYRNWFLSEPDGEELCAWQGLVACGYATGGPTTYSRFHSYRITDAGRAALAEHGVVREDGP